MSSSDLNNTVTQHPLQDVDLTATTSSSSTYASNENINQNLGHTTTTATATSAATKNVNKENWVKFDDDVNEGILGTNNNNNNKIQPDNDHMNASVVSDVAVAPTSANRLTPSPLPPPTNTKRHSAAAGIARPRTPTMESGSIQQLHTIQLDAATPPVQRSMVSSSVSIPDVAAPAVLTTESTHVDLNASGKTPPQQQQQQHLQQHYQTNNNNKHHQKPSSTPTTAASVVGVQNNSIAASASSNNVATGNIHHNQQLPHHSNHVASNKLGPGTSAPTTAASTTNNVQIPVESQPSMRTIELSTGRIREGFANGDVIVTLLPANTKFPWVTPAIFRPELVPEELMAQGLTLTVEEYVHAMETLVNDYRFTMYNICYKRILVCWILFAFTVLLTLLFSGLQGVALFSLGVGWLFLNAAAIFLCMWVKLRLARGLEKCLARVNKQLIKHKILLILDDRGRISCHKVNLCFLYFDSGPCVNFLNEFLEHTEQNGGETVKAGWESKLDIDLNDIVIQGTNPVRVSRKQAVAQELYLSYLQRWGKDFLRRRLDWTVQEAGVHETPRHLQSSICPCQYEEEVLRNKIKMHLQRKQCCGINCLGCWL